MDGTVRRQDGNEDGVAIVDMGAYEHGGTPALSTVFILDPSDPDSIPDAAFRNPHIRAALGHKIEVVLQMIDYGDCAPALGRLHNDLLRKTAGCAATGVPDKADWIVDCTYQAIAHERVTRAIEALRVIIREQ